LLSFEDGLKWFQNFSNAKSMRVNIFTMAAVLGLADNIVRVCASIDGVVVAANYKLSWTISDFGRNISC
jgi:hypothetical protein